MFRKTLLLAILLAALPGAALATSSTTLSRSDEDFLAEMDASDFPGAGSVPFEDKDDDGIADGVDNEIAIPDPFKQAEEATQKKEENVKYVYEPGSNTTLRRTIQDDRIEDGFVQDLLRQRGPE